MDYSNNNGVYLDSGILQHLAKNIYRTYRRREQPYGVDFQRDYDTLKILSNSLPAGYYDLDNVPFPKIEYKSDGQPVSVLSILKDWYRR